MYKSAKFVLYCCLFKFATCFLYDVGFIDIFQSSAGYFGYSVFLQQSDPSFLVVGSPTSNVTGGIHICNISDAKPCSPYFPKTTNKGLYNLYGASIDGGTYKGDPVMVCSPKFTITKIYQLDNNTDDVNYFANGACNIFKDFNEPIDPQPIFPNSGKEQIDNKKYHFAFGEAGLSLRYLSDSGEFILGSPGISGWSGSAIRVHKNKEELPPQTREVSHVRRSRTTFEFSHINKLIGRFDEYEYAGYAVTTGSFLKGKTHYVIGVPRGNKLRGTVYITEKNDYGSPYSITPEKNDVIGTYFGSSVCTADVNGDGLDDLLVGAPFRKNEQYNDGAVYEYRNDGYKLLFNKIITPTSASGQFGTAMTNLGKVALGSADTVVISSPYENYGKGALYIYIGSPSGLTYNSKIERDEFQSLGFSLSRGVDVDYNGVVDIAAGAYKSQKVVVFKAKPVFYYKFNVPSISLYSYKKNLPFKYNYCVVTAELGKMNSVVTTVKIKFDNRLQNQNKEYTINITNQHCEDLVVTLKDNFEDFTKPIKISMEASEKSCVSCPVASPIFEKRYTHKIPFLFDCGSDHICTPDIKIETNLDNSSFLVGTQDRLKLVVNVNNMNEYAYLCKLELELQKEISLKTSPKYCQDNLCTLKNPIEKKDSLEFTLDFEKFRYVIPNLSIGMKVNCLNYTRKFMTYVNLSYKTKFTSKGSHDSYIYKNKNITGVVNGTFKYFIRNEGPSPIRNEDFLFRIPISLKGLESEKIFDIFEPKIEQGRIICKANMNYSNPYENSTTEVDNKAILHAQVLSSEKPDNISCEDSHIECMEIKCTIQDMIKGDQFTVQIPVRPNINKILQHYGSTFTVNSQFQFTQRDDPMTTVSSMTLQDYVEGTYISIFWAIFGVVIGLLLLGAVIYGLYKLNFFKRQSYDKMKEQENEQMAEELFELSNENNGKQDSNPE